MLLFAVVFSVGLFQSCEKEPTVSQDEIAPPIPPLETFLMDFKTYEDLDTPGVNSTIEIRNNPTYVNWFHAGSNLLFWNTVVSVEMAIPVASFAAAFNHQAVPIGNATFLWTYDVEIFGETYIAALTGQFLSLEEVLWEMKVSKVGGFTDVTFYTGIVRTDFTEANWTVYHKPYNPEPLVSIEFQRNATNDDVSLNYTNIVPDGPFNGHYIEYRSESAADLNRMYDVFRGSDIDFLEIEWNEPNRNGRVRHPKRFNDSEWHCWDTELRDTEC